MPSTGDRYVVDDPDYDAVRGVLRNIPGVSDPAELERLERDALIAAYDQAALAYSEAHCFTAGDIRRLHRLFMGNLFEWAGSYRRIDLVSGEIRWCHAAHIDGEMRRFGRRLTALTPFAPDLERSELVARLAELHCELIVIHPFRDGNGRTTRLLCDLLLMQAELPPIQFGAFDDVQIRRLYHQSIREAWITARYDGFVALLDRLVE